MSDWTLKDLENWDTKICELGLKNELDWYPITYETCDYFEMIGNMSYHGMPTHYGHWSFGKSFEIQSSQYQHGAKLFDEGESTIFANIDHGTLCRALRLFQKQ
jgi:stage V sporulation protein R